MIWVDGYKWPPDLHGTGSEDYLGHAGGMQKDAALRNGSSIFEGYTVPTPEINLWRGKLFSHATQWNEMIATDLTHKVTKLILPVYFFHGRYDYTCSYDLAKAHFQRLAGPIKGFYTFEQSAHSPVFEEPEKMRRILREDVLAGANRLADALCA